jgi:ribosomal protein RSM22 (predicted rRNA methylase)
MGSFEEFRRSIGVLAERIPQRELARSFDRIAARYDRGGGATAVASPAEVAAYAIGRGLATYSAIERVLREIARVRPDWRPRSVLDVGAGIGSGAWAALTVFESVEEVICVESSRQMAAAGAELSSRSDKPALRDARWVLADAARALSGRFDLVICAYLLGELPSDDDVPVGWFDSTAGELAIVDVGSPRGFAGVLRVRDMLIARGATITAPCPHEAPCPMSDGDWCHFAARVLRSQMHRQVKGGVRAFEDEKFSYVVVSKQGPVDRSDRVVRRPAYSTGRVQLRLCTPVGLRDRLVARGERDLYRRARKTAWGDAFGEP